MDPYADLWNHVRAYVGSVKCNTVAEGLGFDNINLSNLRWIYQGVGIQGLAKSEI